MRISGPLALASQPAVPWKNGGGTTRTLIAVPEGASLEDFVWRVSLASIEEDGSFSNYPGVDRTILLWQGGGMRLRSPAWPDHTLSEPCQPFAFRGEDPVSCQLLGSSAQDLNLMVRRGRAVGSVSSHASEAALTAGGEAVVLCARGAVRIAPLKKDARALEAGQYICLRDLDTPVTVLPLTPQSRVVCIQVKPLLSIAAP